MKIDLSITEIAIIHSVLKKDKADNPYPDGYIINDQRDKAIATTQAATEDFDRYLGLLREEQLLKRKKEAASSKE